MSSSTAHGGSDPVDWVDRYGDSLFRYAMARLRHRESAEEVVQETLLAALQARGQYSGKGTEGAWLLGICKRKVIDAVRRRRRRDAAVGGDLGDDPSASFFDATGHWRFDPRFLGQQPDEALRRGEFWASFRDCVGRLPPRQAEVFLLRELDDEPSEKICKDLEITASNLWVLLHRARLSLTRCLRRYLGDEAGAR